MINKLGDITTIRKVVKCPHCKGEKTEFRWDALDQRYVITCTYCQGDGVVVKETSIRYLRHHAIPTTREEEIVGTQTR